MIHEFSGLMLLNAELSLILILEYIVCDKLHRTGLCWWPAQPNASQSFPDERFQIFIAIRWILSYFAIYMVHICVDVWEKCVLMSRSSLAIFSGKNWVSVILFGRITDNLSVTTEFGFRPETPVQGPLLPVGKVTEIERAQSWVKRHVMRTGPISLQVEPSQYISRVLLIWASGRAKTTVCGDEDRSCTCSKAHRQGYLSFAPCLINSEWPRNCERERCTHHYRRKGDRLAHNLGDICRHLSCHSMGIHLLPAQF
jgi:hypothetical protein